MTSRFHRAILVMLVCCSAATLFAPGAAAQRRGNPPPPPPPQTAHHRTFVFIGGYFYDVQFGPYPWWPRRAYPYAYYPLYDNRADVRVLVTPKEAAVYVDGFYAGIVDDFNGFFERLTLPPGGHDIALFLEGYRTIHQRIYLSPGSTFRLQIVMAPLGHGEVSQPPAVAPPPPPPPDGSFIRPRTPPRRAIPPAPAPAVPGLSTLSLNVQPPDADVLIDGQRWMSSDAMRFVIQIAPGAHLLQVSKSGYQPFEKRITLQDGEQVSLNVSLMKLPH